MNVRTTLVAVTTAAMLLTASGCAVIRGQETVGAYIDDATITTQIKASLVDDMQVHAASIHVETLNATVWLSGFANSVGERRIAERIARGVNGVRSVRNEIVIRR